MGMRSSHALAAVVMAYLATECRDTDKIVRSPAFRALVVMLASQLRTEKRRRMCAEFAMALGSVVLEGTLRQRLPNVHRDRDRVLAKIRALSDAEFGRQYRLGKLTFYNLLEQVSMACGIPV